MPRIRGLPDQDLDTLIAWFEDLVARALRAVARAVARALAGTTHGPAALGVDDLAPIRVEWAGHVDATVAPALATVYQRTASAVADQLAAFGHDIAALTADDAEGFLARARNRLVGVGDVLWEAARDQLGEGLAAAEDVGQLAARVRDSAGVSEARARVIARSEVLAATNAASLAQARLLADPTMVKEWLATPGPEGVGCDERTRPTHCKADGQRVSIGGRFQVGLAHLDFPGDPSSPHPEETANCRCSIAIDLDDEPLAASADFHLPGRHNQEDHANTSRSTAVAVSGITKTHHFAAGTVAIHVDGDGLHLAVATKDGGSNASGPLDREAAWALSDLLEKVGSYDDADLQTEQFRQSVAAYRESGAGTAPTGFAEVTVADQAIRLELLDSDTKVRLTQTESAQLAATLYRYGVARRVETAAGAVDVYVTDDDHVAFGIADLSGERRKVAFDGKSWAGLYKAINLVFEGFDEFGDVADPGQDLAAVQVRTNVGDLRVERVGAPVEFEYIRVQPVDSAEWSIVTGPADGDLLDAISWVDSAAGPDGLDLYDPDKPAKVSPLVASVDPEGTPMAQPMPAETEQVHAGAMIALAPSEAHAARLTVDGGEPADQLHVTLLYLGEAADIPAEARAALVERLRELVEETVGPDFDGPITADGFAVSLFNPPGVVRDDGKQRDPCVVLGLSGDDLDALRDLVVGAVDEVDAADEGWALPEQHAPWIPHITLAYNPDPGMVTELSDRVGPVTFDRLRVTFAGELIDIPLGSAIDVEPDPPAGEDEAEDEFAAGQAFQSDAKLRQYWIRGAGAAKIRWNTPGDFTRCVRQLRKYVRDPEGLCAEYHHEATGMWPGDKRNQDSAAPAEGQMEANMPNDQTPATSQDCPPGQHPTPEGECVPDAEVDGEPGLPEHFHAIMHVEGISTGLRIFEPDALDWRGPPFAFHWQRGSSAHSGQPATVHIGNVTRAERDGVTLHGWGRFDLRSPDGLDYARRLAEGFERWVSIGLDESLKESDIVYVWPEGAESASADGVDMLFVDPEEMRFQRGRIAELTGVSVPAQAEATIEPTQALIDELAALGVLVAAAVGAHDTATVDGEWDADTNVKRLPDDADADALRQVFAWLPDADPTKSAAKLPHHEVSEDGQPGAANLTACSAGIAALHGARGGTTIPEADTRGVYDHLAAHLRSGGQEPPEFDPGPIVAAGYTIEIPDVPPAWWFDEPVDVTPHGALTVTDQGRVYGYVAPNNLAHRSFPDRRVTVPTGRVDYTRWMGGEALVAGGRVVAGPITMECGHLPADASSASDVRMQHYDNSCAVVAKARVGENAHGVWIAGALEPGVTADQVSRMLACRLSGDWAPHPERAGWREFVAALLVPVPGFPMARSAPSVRVTDGALAASAVPVRIVHADRDTVPEPDLRPTLDLIARTSPRLDPAARLAALRGRLDARRGVTTDV